MFPKRDLKSHTDRDNHKTSSQYQTQYYIKNPVDHDLIKGVRGQKFLNFIKNILTTYGKVTKSEADMIMSDENNVKMFEICFVHKTYDAKFNYELYEHFGDKIVDYSISKYLYERFPKLGDVNYNPTLALKIVSKLHLLVRSKAFLSKAGESLGFKEYISANSATFSDAEIHSTYEDIFEAFMGVCDRAINKITKEQVGYIICYEILKNVFNALTISLKYEDVIDARTRIKEFVQKRNGDKSYSYGYETLSTPMRYSSFISFNTTDSMDNIVKMSTSPVVSNKKDEGASLAYKMFFDMIRSIPSGKISNIQLEQTQSGTVYTGDPTLVSIRVFITHNGRTTTYKNGLGYNEASAKEQAAENALEELKQQGFDVNVGGWDYRDWI